MAVVLLLTVLLLVSSIRAELINCRANRNNCECSQWAWGETCTLKCKGSDRCKDHTMTCRSGDACNIRCNGGSSCNDAVIDGSTATDVDILCTGTDSCKGNTALSCGTGLCTVKCDGRTSCEDATIDTSKAIYFLCTGDCPSGSEWAAFGTLPPTTAAPTTATPTTATPTTAAPTTVAPTSTPEPTTESPTTAWPTTEAPASPPNVEYSDDVVPQPTMFPTRPTFEPTLEPTIGTTTTSTMIPTVAGDIEVDMASGMGSGIRSFGVAIDVSADTAVVEGEAMQSTRTLIHIEHENSENIIFGMSFGEISFIAGGAIVGLFCCVIAVCLSYYRSKTQWKQHVMIPMEHCQWRNQVHGTVSEGSHANSHNYCASGSDAEEQDMDRDLDRQPLHDPSLNVQMRGTYVVRKDKCDEEGDEEDSQDDSIEIVEMVPKYQQTNGMVSRFLGETEE